MTFLSWVADDPRSSEAAREAFENPGNYIMVNAAVGWEIEIKEQIGKLPLPEPASQYMPGQIDANGFSELPVTLRHALAAGSLPLHHRDPFDRLLVAQCLLKDTVIITSDPLIAQYVLH
jgi:PIN domain nuclease of toxin-antitoxin system